MANPGLAHLERQNSSEGGLLIVGEALGADDEEAQVLGTSPFVHAHLRKIADLVAQGLCQNPAPPGPPGGTRSGDAARLRPAAKDLAQPHPSSSSGPGH